MRKTCIIIPCYNEEHRLPIEEFNTYYINNFHVSFCFVNDGSSDCTLQLLTKFKNDKERILIFNLEHNVGKAEAIRNGIIKALDWNSFDLIGYFDADLATPLIEIKSISNYIDGNIKFSFGSRINKIGSIIKRNSVRHYFGRIFATISSLILKLEIYDTQCGAKIFTTEIAAIIVKKPFISRWLFDIEIFARLIDHFGHEKISALVIEVPLNKWIEKGHSKIKLVDFIKAPYELVRIFFKYHLYKLYNILHSKRKINPS